MSKEDNKMSIEEAFAKLDETIKKMEDDNVSLDDSFSLYQEGIGLVKLCEEEIDTVEKKVLMLSQNGETDDFS